MYILIATRWIITRGNNIFNQETLQLIWDHEDIILYAIGDYEGPPFNSLLDSPSHFRLQIIFLRVPLRFRVYSFILRSGFVLVV